MSEDKICKSCHWWEKTLYDVERDWGYCRWIYRSQGVETITAIEPKSCLPVVQLLTDWEWTCPQWRELK